MVEEVGWGGENAELHGRDEKNSWIAVVDSESDKCSGGLVFVKMRSPWIGLEGV